MSGLSEDAVYIAAKRVLLADKWILLAGQPPSGCDHLPVIEIKHAARVGIGSLGSYKPDLVAYKNGVFLLVECKPLHNDTDAAKLRSILGDRSRVAELFEEIRVRNILVRHQIECSAEMFRFGLRGALAHGGSVVQQRDLLVIGQTNRSVWKTFLPTSPDSMLSAAFPSR